MSLTTWTIPTWESEISNRSSTVRVLPSTACSRLKVECVPIFESYGCSGATRSWPDQD